MARITALIGIGFMLVGALAYALPQQQNVYWLIPAFIGVLTSASGFYQIYPDRGITFANLGAVVLLAVYSVVRLKPDILQLSNSHIELIADISIIGYAIVLIYALRRYAQIRAA